MTEADHLLGANERGLDCAPIGVHPVGGQVTGAHLSRQVRGDSFDGDLTVRNLMP